MNSPERASNRAKRLPNDLTLCPQRYSRASSTTPSTRPKRRGLRRLCEGRTSGWMEQGRNNRGATTRLTTMHSSSIMLVFDRSAAFVESISRAWQRRRRRHPPERRTGDTSIKKLHAFVLSLLSIALLTRVAVAQTPSGQNGRPADTKPVAANDRGEKHGVEQYHA